METVPKPAIAYYRVASVLQATEHNGILEQEKICHEYAETEGFQVLETFKDEGVSGNTLTRSGLSDMLNFVKQHKDPVAVLVSDGHVIARNVLDFQKVKTVVVEAGGDLVSVANQTFNEADTAFIQSVLLAKVELEDKLESEAEKGH